MRVGADHDAAWPDETLLHHQLVADAFLEDVGDPEVVGEVANDLMEAGRGYGVRRKDVIEDHDHPLGIPEWHVELAKGLDRQRPRHVVGHGIVNRGDHDLARMNSAAEPSGEDLFSQCSHLISPKRGPIPAASRRVRRWSTGPNPRAV